MINLIVGCIVSFILGGAAGYIYLSITGKLK
jgi:hypothetical protein